MAARKAQGGSAAPPPGLNMDFNAMLTGAVRGIMESALPQCQVEGCSGRSIQSAVEQALGVPMACAKCGRHVCLKHYFFVPKPTPVPVCTECIVRHHELWRRDQGLSAVQTPREPAAPPPPPPHGRAPSPPPPPSSGRTSAPLTPDVEVVDAEFTEIPPRRR